jgi:hypothetical protein
MTDPFSRFGGALSDTLFEIPTFSAEEAAALAEAVLADKAHWTDRGWFWTLGASAYIDPPDIYYANTLKGNSILASTYADALMRVFEVIGETSKLSVAPLSTPENEMPPAGLPGFHIIADRTNGRSGMFHVDLPYQRVFWPGPFIQPFSFTTLIQTPTGGTGLWHWDDMDMEEGRRIIKETTNDSRTSVNILEEGRSFTPYEVGITYFHSGRVPHAIPNMGDIAPGEHRITIQGHGAYLPEDDVLAVYF